MDAPCPLVKTKAMKQPLAIDFQFQRSGFTDDEIAEYTGLFDDIAYTKSRTYVMPAAGAAFAIIIVITFLAEHIAGGIAYDVLKDLSFRLVKLFKRKEEISSSEPEISAVHFAFKDKDIVLGIDDHGVFTPDEYSIHKKVLESLGDTYNLILPHLKSSPLAESTFQALRVPVLASSEAADAPLVKQYWKFGDRFGFGHFTSGGTYYDMNARAIVEIKRKQQ